MDLVKCKGIPVELDGKTYIAPPIALGPLEQLQDRISKFSGDVSDMSQVSTAIDVAFAALRRNYPELTREQVADMVDVGNMAEIFEAVMDVSGLKRKELEQSGEAKPG